MSEHWTGSALLTAHSTRDSQEADLRPGFSKSRSMQFLHFASVLQNHKCMICSSYKMKSVNMQGVKGMQTCAMMAAPNVSSIPTPQSQPGVTRERCSGSQRAVLRGADVCMQAARRSMTARVCPSHWAEDIPDHASSWDTYPLRIEEPFSLSSATQSPAHAYMHRSPVRLQMHVLAAVCARPGQVWFGSCAQHA